MPPVKTGGIVLHIRTLLKSTHPYVPRSPGVIWEI